MIMQRSQKLINPTTFIPGAAAHSIQGLNLTDGNYGSARLLYDRINVHVRDLHSLGIGSGSFLIPVVMSKMPLDIRLRITHETKSEVWKIL